MLLIFRRLILCRMNGIIVVGRFVLFVRLMVVIE